jgi:hypothetical protein
VSLVLHGRDTALQEARAQPARRPDPMLRAVTRLRRRISALLDQFEARIFLAPF